MWDTRLVVKVTDTSHIPDSSEAATSLGLGALRAAYRTEVSSALDPATILADYDVGISLAQKEGCIFRAPDFGTLAARGIKDRWSHIEGIGPAALNSLNCRGFLCEVVDVVTSAYHSTRSLGSEFHFLELGPGAGLAVASLSRCAPAAVIETISLSPINPYLRWKVEDLESLWRKVSSHDRSNYFEPATTSYRIQDLLQQQARGGVDVLEIVDVPFIHKQHLGLFPHQITLPKEHYQVIYDNFGALVHLGTSFLEDQLDSDRLTLGCRQVRDWLSSDGVLILDNRHGQADVVVQRLSTTLEQGEVLFSIPPGSEQSGAWILARSEAPILRAIR